MQKGMDLSEANLKDVLQKQQQTLQAASTYPSELEEKINSIGDDAQLANVDLQNLLQKQEQALQELSNISKMFRDTAMEVVRHIGS